MTDALTESWCRNPSDVKACANGCRFDAERAAYVAWWIERYCKLYEGEQAGEPLTLRGCHECDSAHQEFDSWEDAKPPAMERAARHAACYAAGHRLDWQYECVMRLFGWVKHSAKWDREVRRFKQASVWVPKKNKKSPTLAAVGLYLLCGDGEPGNKVFFGAKDGKQARDIAGKHAVEMVESSPALTSECTINRNLFRITHEPSRSLMEPLSSGNSRHQQSKEGLNGSVLIDETHVVDREFVGRISRAGISRSEPLQIEVSTAGSDPEGYGKERYDLAERIVKGDTNGDEYEHVFAAVYAAPQDLSDADLAADPLKYGYMANPAMGHTVDPEEFLRDYHSSKNSLAELGRFKMYRLNIWQASETPWLPQDRWAQARREYGEDDLLAMPCAAALDLAKTRDTCALVLLFWDEANQVARQLPYFWLPRQRAEALRDKVNYLGWAANGFLTLTDGDVTDYGVIRREIVRLKQKFNVAKLVYDDHYAEQLIQQLVGEDRVFLDTEVMSFPQTVSAFAGPSDDYEGDLRDGKLWHPGNPVLDWQAKNVKVKTDSNHNKRPVKQAFGDHRTIDGIVAAVMARSQLEEIKRGSVYEERGILTF